MSDEIKVEVVVPKAEAPTPPSHTTTQAVDPPREEPVQVAAEQSASSPRVGQTATLEELRREVRQQAEELRALLDAAKARDQQAVEAVTKQADAVIASLPKEVQGLAPTYSDPSARLAWAQQAAALTPAFARGGLLGNAETVDPKTIYTGPPELKELIEREAQQQGFTPAQCWAQTTPTRRRRLLAKYGMERK